MPIRTYRCPAGHTHDALVSGHPPTRPCEMCGAEARSVVTAATFHIPGSRITRDSVNGAYDPGLGRHIRDEAHRQEVMRELGVVEASWGGMMEDQRRNDSVRDAHDDQVVREMLQGMEHGPDAAALKTARDQGRVLDWSEHAKTLGVT